MDFSFHHIPRNNVRIFHEIFVGSNKPSKKLLFIDSFTNLKKFFHWFFLFTYFIFFIKNFKILLLLHFRLNRIVFRNFAIIIHLSAFSFFTWLKSFFFFFSLFFRRNLKRIFRFWIRFVSGIWWISIDNWCLLGNWIILSHLLWNIWYFFIHFFKEVSIRVG